MRASLSMSCAIAGKEAVFGKLELNRTHLS
jgi:hypothetical protein